MLDRVDERRAAHDESNGFLRALRGKQEKKKTNGNMKRDFNLKAESQSPSLNTKKKEYAQETAKGQTSWAIIEPAAAVCLMCLAHTQPNNLDDRKETNKKLFVV